MWGNACILYVYGLFYILFSLWIIYLSVINISVIMHVMDSNFTYRNVVCISPCMVAIALIAQNVARNK